MAGVHDEVRPSRLTPSFPLFLPLRSWMRLLSTASKFISCLMQTLMRTRSSRSRPESWRWKSDTELISSVTELRQTLPDVPSAGLVADTILFSHILTSLHFSLITLFSVSPSSNYVSLHPLDPLTFVSFSQASIPFAVIGSNQLIEVKGKKIRGRLYPWGVVEVENPEHNDFLKLRTMLVWVSLAIKPLTLQHFRKESL